LRPTRSRGLFHSEATYPTRPVSVAQRTDSPAGRPSTLVAVPAARHSPRGCAAPPRRDQGPKGGCPHSPLSPLLLLLCWVGARTRWRQGGRERADSNEQATATCSSVNAVALGRPSLCAAVHQRPPDFQDHGPHRLAAAAAAAACACPAPAFPLNATRTPHLGQQQQQQQTTFGFSGRQQRSGGPLCCCCCCCCCCCFPGSARQLGAGELSPTSPTLLRLRPPQNWSRNRARGIPEEKAVVSSRPSAGRASEQQQRRA